MLCPAKTCSNNMISNVVLYETRFTQSNSLKAHRQIHTGDKPVFQCELCPTTCGRKTDLRLHIQKLHTSDKPLHCKMCGKSFPDRYALKVSTMGHSDLLNRVYTFVLTRKVKSK